MESWLFTLDIVVLLSACLFLGGVFSRFGQSPIVGYLLAGTILGGASGTALIHSEQGIEDIAELGVALLLFSLGLEFSWARIRKFGSRAIFVGLLQVVITALTATSLGYLFGCSIVEAIAIGAMVCLSSTACVLRILSDRRDLDSVHGRSAISVLLLQDIAVVPLAILMTVLSGGQGESGVLVGVGKIILSAGALIVSLYIVINKAAVLALGRMTLERNRELAVLLAVVAALGSTWAAHQFGLSPALGAFVAGMFLGGTSFATQIRADISSLRVIFLTLFFGAAGMVADPFWIVSNLPLVLSVTVALILIKTGLIWAIMLGFGFTHSSAVATGLTLSQVGEFAFVLGSIGKRGGVVSDEIYMLIVSCTILSLFVTPNLIAAAPRIGLFFERKLRQNYQRASISQEKKIAPEILLIGFGPTGKAIANSLLPIREKVLVLDLNRDLVNEASELGFPVMLGDALQLDVLDHVGIATVQLVVITIPARFATLTLLQHIRRLAPEALTFVRSRYQIDKPDFEAAGATLVVGDEEEVGSKLREAVLEMLNK